MTVRQAINDSADTTVYFSIELFIDTPPPLRDTSATELNSSPTFGCRKSVSLNNSDVRILIGGWKIAVCANG